MMFRVIWPKENLLEKPCVNKKATIFFDYNSFILSPPRLDLNQDPLVNGRIQINRFWFQILHFSNILFHFSNILPPIQALPSLHSTTDSPNSTQPHPVRKYDQNISD